MRITEQCALCGQWESLSECLEGNGRFVCFECSYTSEGRRLLMRPAVLPPWIKGFRDFAELVEGNGHWLVLPPLRQHLLKILDRLNAEARKDLQP